MLEEVGDFSKNHPKYLVGMFAYYGFHENLLRVAIEIFVRLEEDQTPIQMGDN